MRRDTGAGGDTVVDCCVTGYVFGGGAEPGYRDDKAGHVQGCRGSNRGYAWSLGDRSPEGRERHLG